MQSTQIIYFENECCTLELDQTVNCLIMNWKGLLPSKAFREVHQEALHLIRKHKISKILGDARRMKTIGSEDSRWIEEFWLPSAIAAGFLYNAIIESDYVFNQHCINSIVEKVDPSQITFQFFRNYDTAVTWLRNI